MTIEQNGEAYVGEFDGGKETGYGYCYRTYEKYEVPEQVIITSVSKKIRKNVTSAIYEG